MEFNPYDSNIGNNTIKYNYEGNSINKNIDIRSSIVTIRFLDKELNRVLLECEIKIGTLFETDIYTTGVNKLALDHNGMAIGFKISDGRLGKDGLHKEYFSRVINEDTDIECEMLRFDYYFTSTGEFINSKNGILEENNNDLSSKIFAFSDKYNIYLDYLFRETELLKTPKMIICRIARFSNQMFLNCSNLSDISSLLFYYIKGIETLDSCFKNCPRITQIPESLFINNDNMITFESNFDRLVSLESIPEKLFNSFINVRSLGGSFSYCDSLKIIPSRLFYNNINLRNVAYCFTNCHKLKYVPFDLFENNNLIEHVNSVFQNDSEIISKLPEVWNSDKYPKLIGKSGYARGCIKAINYNEIPDEFK